MDERIRAIVQNAKRKVFLSKLTRRRKKLLQEIFSASEHNPQKER